MADIDCDVRVRKIKIQFLQQINSILDWGFISQTINTYYFKGKSASGKPSYDGLLFLRLGYYKNGIDYVTMN